MTSTVLPLRTIITPACWPHSGYKYEVWEGNKRILRTDSLQEAEACAMGL